MASTIFLLSPSSAQWTSWRAFNGKPPKRVFVCATSSKGSRFSRRWTWSTTSSAFSYGSLAKSCAYLNWFDRVAAMLNRRGILGRHCVKLTSQILSRRRIYYVYYTCILFPQARELVRPQRGVRAKQAIGNERLSDCYEQMSKESQPVNLIQFLPAARGRRLRMKRINCGSPKMNKKTRREWSRINSIEDTWRRWRGGQRRRKADGLICGLETPFDRLASIGACFNVML